jgi:streptomycin 6-kinase
MNAWNVRPDGASLFGYVGVVVPVVGADGARYALKVSYPDDESLGEAPALRAWAGVGAVRLLALDETGFAMLLEWLDPDRSLFDVPADEGVATIGGLLRRLHRTTAPPSVARLSEVSERWSHELPAQWRQLGITHDRRLLDAALATVRELGPSAGDRMLHGDLHYGNVLAGTREPWLVIDPKGLAGDPAFDVVPCVWNRFDELVAGGDAHRAVRRRIDALCEASGIDRDPAYRWTVARAVDDLLWTAASTDDGGFGDANVLIAEAVLR